MRAKLWLKTTTIAETSRGPRMLQQLTDKAFDTMKFMAEDDDWFSDPQNGQRLLDEMSKPERFGKEELESLWSALHRLFYSKLKHTDDELVSFRNRFDEATRKVERHKVKLPSEALGFIYLRQAQVDEMTLERIVTITKGDLSLPAVIEAMRKLKMRLIQADEDERRKPHVWLQQSLEQDDSSGNVETLHETHAEDEEMDILESALRDLGDDTGDDERISEVDAKEILMTLVKQKMPRSVQNFSYKQVQNMKNDLKNSRGFRTPYVQPVAGMKKDIQHLKSITQCRNCGMTGHWHKECPQKAARSSSGNSSASGANQSSSRESDAVQKTWWSLAESIDHEVTVADSHE